MNKLKKLFQFIGILISEPYRINTLLEDNHFQKKLFKKSYPDKTKGLPLVALENFVEKEITVDCMTLLDGGSYPTDLALLMSLAKNIKDCDYFEMGTWRGESIVNVSKYAKNCTTFNLSDSEMKSKGASQLYISQTGMFLHKAAHINFIRGNTYTYDFSQLNKKFDLIFIDADHHYDSVLNDTKKVFEFLKKDNSIIVWHDYTYSPDKIRYEVYRAILDAVPSDAHMHLYHVKNTNCAIFIKKEMKGETLEYPMYPETIFEITLNLKKS